MNKRNCIVLFLVFAVVLCLFASCQQQSTENKTGEKKVVSLSVNVPNHSFVVGEKDFSDVSVEINYDDGTSDTVILTEELIAEADRSKLYSAGKKELQLIYRGVTTKIYLDMVAAEDVYYTVSITGGYISEINGKNIVSPVIPERDQTYSQKFLSGTEIVINWKKEGNNNFEYWTVNDLKNNSLQSSFKTVITSDIDYHAYSSAVARRVFFHTAFEDEGVMVESQTAELLNESNIKTISQPGYVFLGWTTDVITKEQAISGYSGRFVKFPYEVQNDVDFYAVWTPVGLTYKAYEDGYEVVSFNGNVTTVAVPETYSDKPVLKISADAFNTEKGYYLTEITLPASLEVIENGAFAHCAHLEKFKVEATSSHFITLDGILFALNATGDIATELVAYPAAKIKDIYMVPDSVKVVRENAFCDASVGAIVLGSGTVSVEKYAFNSVHIDYVDFSEVNPSLVTLGRSLFDSHLSSVYFSVEKADAFNEFDAFDPVRDKITHDRDDLTSFVTMVTTEADGNTSVSVYRMIQEENFENDGDSLELLFTNRSIQNFTLQVKLGDYMVTSVAEYAFSSCEYLTSFILPLGTRLERICDNVFDDTPWAKTLKDGLILSQNELVLYKYLGNNSVVKLNNYTEKIAEGAFSGNKKIRYLDITDNAAIKTIAAYAFYDCSAFVGFICTPNPTGDGLYFKKSVTTVGSYAFYGTAITRIVLQAESSAAHNAWCKIGDGAFAFCDRLISVQLAKPMESIANNAFVNCYALQEFVLSESNSKYVVYDGILYETEGDALHLFCYPAGRADMEFDPSVRMNYPTKAVEIDERNYMEKDANSGEVGNSVGDIYFNGVKYELYMSVIYQKSDLTQGTGTDGTLYYHGARLRETTAYDSEGNPNGEKYFYFYEKTNNTKRKLVYDADKQTYCYDLELNVTEICNYALYYSNIAALRIPETVDRIADYAVLIPGLVYAVFEKDPVVDYYTLFGKYEPDFVVLSADTSSSLKNKFYMDNEDLLENKDESDIYYTFFYGYDTETGEYDHDVMYAYNTRETGNVKVSVVRSSRTALDITVPQDVFMKTNEGMVQVGASSMKKNIFPYAFFGGILRSVHLNMIEKIRSHAFSEAYEMTMLEVNTDFINNVEADVFGEKLNNGLYIYDYTNGIDLYQNVEGWGLEYFTYTDIYEIEQYASRYLIRSPDGAFAVVVYQNEDLTSSTASVEYGAIPVQTIRTIESSIDKEGYSIAYWKDDDGNIVRVDSDYSVPYNQILMCYFVAQEYVVYLHTSPSVSFEYQVESEDVTGLITYVTSVEYGSEYSFIPSQNTQDRYVFWRTEDNELLETTGTWRIATSENEINLRVDFGYKIIYDVSNENASVDNEYTFVFNGASFTLEVPETIDAKQFRYWAIGEERTPITDATGKSLSGWNLTRQNDYTVYAVWE